MRPVTLLAADCVCPELAVKALQVSQLGWEPAATLLLSHRRPATLPADIRFIPIQQLRTLSAYNVFMLRQLYRYVTTDYCLSVHTDGFLLNADCWKPVFFDYDYVGAVWPPDRWNGYTPWVGNSGFCLRSRRFLEWTARAPGVWLEQHRRQRGQVVDDLFACYDYRAQAEEQLRIAPLEVADLFSLEFPRAPVTHDTLRLDKVLGFHGKVTPATQRCCDWLQHTDCLTDKPWLTTPS